MRVVLASAKNRLATGVDRYARELSRALRERDVQVREEVIERRELRIGPLRVGGNISIAWQRARLAKGDADLLHALDPAVAPKEADVVTIHDVLYEEFPELADAGTKLDWSRMRARSRTARWIVTPSEATRQAVVARWGIGPDRVVAIPHGIDHDVFRPTAARSTLLAEGRPTLVYVGDDNPRKNVGLVVDALARGKLDARLVRVGPSRFPEVHEAYRRAAKEQGVDLVEPGYLGDAELAPLLSHAAAFVWPTRGEGFGFPPLEAMACGAPVVALATPINEEVCGPLARYHADDAASCAEAIAEVIAHPPSAEILTAYARQFTWRAAAEKTKQVYERALEDRRR